MKGIVLSLISALCPLVMSAQIVEGTWNGVLDVEGTELTMVVHIGEECTLDVPSQGAKGIPMEYADRNALKIKWEIPMIGASFEGLYINKSIVGTFSQTGMRFPLTFKPGDIRPNRPQTPVPPFAYITEEVQFCNDDAVLSGTLSMPEGRIEDMTVVLLVSGSGLQNRDEELMDHKPFAVIADAFAKEGIATLRYDDRSCGKSTGDASKATTLTFMQDAAAGTDYLRELGFKRVGVLGHSEGGTIAFMLAAEGKADFIVSMAGMAEKGEDLIRKQTEHILRLQGVPVPEARQYAENVVAQNRASGNPWMTYFMDLDASQYVARVSCPVFAINGEKDSQVLCEDNLSIVRALLPHAAVKAYPGLNHVFQHCATGAPTEYYEIEETISPEVLEDMVRWIKSL